MPAPTLPIRRPRRLPIFVTPSEGESFGSYVERLAAALDVSVSGVLAATIGTEGGRALLRYGATLPAKQSDSFALATGLSATELNRMLLDAYTGIVFCRGPSTADQK